MEDVASKKRRGIKGFGDLHILEGLVNAPQTKSYCSFFQSLSLAAARQSCRYQIFQRSDLPLRIQETYTHCIMETQRF